MYADFNGFTDDTVDGWHVLPQPGVLDEKASHLTSAPFNSPLLCDHSLHYRQLQEFSDVSCLLPAVECHMSWMAEHKWTSCCIWPGFFHVV
jgi:hypothetical protein